MTNLKKYGIYAVAALVLAGGGYATGRYAAPDKVVVTEKLVRVETEKTVSVVDTDKILNAIKTINEARNIHKVVQKVKTPDGTVTTTTTSDDKTVTTTKDETQNKEKTQSTTNTEKLTLQTKETTKTVERNRPGWGLTLSPGYDFAGALGHNNAYSVLPSGTLQHVVLGVSLERRLIGPLSTGLWANTAGMGGLTIRLEF
jgi:hypothetical protein